MYSFAQKILDIVVDTYKINLPNIDSCLSNPPKPELGDFAFSCYTIAKEIKANPNEIATNLARVFDNDKNSFAGASSMGGYVNFSLTDKVFVENLSTIDISEKPKNNETIIVDYIGANAGKPLHIGHLCTPSIGQSIINTYKHLGYNVISDSHFGDWGGIFGKLIYTWKFGPEFNDCGLDIGECLVYFQDKQDTYKNKLFKECMLSKHGVIYLVKLYQLFFEFIAEEDHESIEEDAKKESQYLSGVGIDLSNPEELAHHKENVELWKKFTSISIAEVNKSLEALNIKPQYNIGESFYEGLNLPRPNNEDYPELKYNMKDIVKELLVYKVAIQNDDGSVGVVFPDEAKMPSCVLQKKDGTGLYLTSDLAAIKYRLTNGWKPSKIIYCVDVRQQLHLKQAFHIAHNAWDKDGLDKVELFHAYNGFIKLKEGAMSTRKGTVIFLKDLIEEGYSRTREILEGKGRQLSEDNIRKITIAAIKYSYLSQDREKDIVFDWDKALNFEGNSGPYIQYAYVRASKIMKEVDNTVRHPELDSGSMDAEINSAGRKENFSKDNNIIIDPELLKCIPSGTSSGGQIENSAGQELTQFDKSMIKKLSQFGEKVQESANKYKPHIIAQYCYELAGEFNSFYVNTPKILEEKNENLKNIRLIIINKTKEVLLKGFELLAIDMPNEM